LASHQLKAFFMVSQFLMPNIFIIAMRVARIVGESRIITNGA
jgi:hypothetical protein